ncbi:MAG: hypothetical protein EBT86_08185 [Actinobacteria bacterium]|nr:hypothetical protein [Actinomycetota bacterium]
MANKYPLVLSGNVIQELQIGDNLTTTDLSSGDATTTGRITGTWVLTPGSSMEATFGADLAEWYTSDKAYESGTVLIFGGEAETTITNVFNDTRVAGVVTTNPAYIMNGEIKDKGTSVCIALIGRVPCKVIGRVRKGDILVTSAIPGHAIKSQNPSVGTVIGKSLEEKHTDESGIIEIVVGK